MWTRDKTSEVGKRKERTKRRKRALKSLTNAMGIISQVNTNNEQPHECHRNYDSNSSNRRVATTLEDRFPDERKRRRTTLCVSYSLFPADEWGLSSSHFTPCHSRFSSSHSSRGSSPELPVRGELHLHWKVREGDRKTELGVLMARQTNGLPYCESPSPYTGAEKLERNCPRG